MSRLREMFVTALGVAAMMCCESCESAGCTDNQNSLPLAGFYSSATGGAITLSGLEIGGVGAKNDTLLYTKNQSLSEVYLPFRSTTDATSYYFHYTQEGLEDEVFNDTVSFEYGSTPHFASEYCGVILYYEVKRMSYTRHLIDSVVVTDSLITNIDRQRVKIYFRTAESED